MRGRRQNKWKAKVSFDILSFLILKVFTLKIFRNHFLDEWIYLSNKTKTEQQQQQKPRIENRNKTKTDMKIAFLW